MIDIKKFESEYCKFLHKELLKSYGFKTNQELIDYYNRINIECDHDIKQYQGFVESYNYCTKCDEKL